LVAKGDEPMKLRTVFLAGLLVLFITAVLVVPVSADPPVVSHVAAHENWLVSASLCPGIEVWDDEVYAYSWTEWYDRGGNLLTVEAHSKGTDNFYNPDNPGVVLTGDFNLVYRWNSSMGLLWDTGYSTGVPYHITIPGYGTVLLRSGRWSGLEIVHLAGKDSFLNSTDLEQFCSCLVGD
jgi:hypothetical protein